MHDVLHERVASNWQMRLGSYPKLRLSPEWVETSDPYTSFLPALPNSVADDLRAVVFVVEGAAKGTVRSAQEYSTALLLLSGVEYESVPFPALHTQLCEALRSGRPRLVAEVFRPDGSVKLIFEQ
jgi:hypothetical protein